MILHLAYEELRALRSGAHVLLGEELGGSSPVMAPSETRARVEALRPRLFGDLTVATLAELRAVDLAVAAIVECLRAEMEAVVVATHPAGEEAVAAYFEYAHALSVAHRIEEMSEEMLALIELVTGSPPDEHTARTFRFPD